MNYEQHPAIVTARNKIIIGFFGGRISLTEGEIVRIIAVQGDN